LAHPLVKLLLTSLRLRQRTHMATEPRITCSPTLLEAISLRLQAVLHRLPCPSWLTARVTLSPLEAHHPLSLINPRLGLLPATHPRINTPLNISTATVCQAASSSSVAIHPRLAFKKSLHYLKLRNTCFSRVTNLFGHEVRLRPD